MSASITSGPTELIGTVGTDSSQPMQSHAKIVHFIVVLKLKMVFLQSLLPGNSDLFISNFEDVSYAGPSLLVNSARSNSRIHFYNKWSTKTF